MASKVTPSIPGAPSLLLAISYAARKVSILQTWTYNRVLCGDNASALDQSCQRTPSPNPGGVVRQPGDVALDRRIGSNGAERHLEQLRMTVVWCDRHKEAVIPLRLQH